MKKLVKQENGLTKTISNAVQIVKVWLWCQGMELLKKKEKHPQIITLYSTKEEEDVSFFIDATNEKDQDHFLIPVKKDNIKYGVFANNTEYYVYFFYGTKEKNVYLADVEFLKEKMKENKNKLLYKKDKDGNMFIKMEKEFWNKFFVIYTLATEKLLN